MKTFVAALSLLLLVSPPAVAGRTLTGKVLGWTADGSRLAYLPVPEDVGLGEFGGTGTVSYGVLLDARTGIIEQRFVVDTSGEVPPEDKKRLKGLPRKEEWKALLAKSAFTCAAPDGVTAEVQSAGDDVKVTHKAAHKNDRFEFQFAGDEMAEEKRAWLTLSVARAGKSFPSEAWSVTQPMAGAGANLSGTVRGCFAPGMRRVAWVLERNSGMMRDTGEWRVIVGPVAAPRIQLVADKAILAAAVTRVATALDAAGVFSTSNKVSNEATPRAASVVYAAVGFEADAAKVAAAVPGGATVAKLDWKAPFEIIVGIGASAMK